MVDPRSGRTLGSGGSSSVGAISYDTQAIKNAFLSRTSGRKLDRRYKDGDAGYFTGGRCGWGAGHNFDEDVQKLVGTFNKVSEMSGAVAVLKDCNSSEQFLAHKNALLAKCNQAIAEMNIGAIESNVGYSTGLCIIWEDHTASFLQPYIIAFTNDLNSQMNEINGLNYEALVELEKLQFEQQQIQGEIEEAYRRYNETDDPNEQEEILVAIRQLKQKYDAVGQKIATNPWNRANRYDYSNNINQLIAILEGKVDPNKTSPFGNKTTNQNNNNNQTNNDQGGGNVPPIHPGGGRPWQPNQPTQNSSQIDQQTLMLIIGVTVVIFLVMNQQKDQPRSRYEDYY